MDKAIWEKVQRVLPSLSLRDQGQVYADTSEFMSISYGDVIALDGRHFVVIRDEAERRFGMEDPKFWVKRCRDLDTDELCILKLVFHEQFDQHIGSIFILCGVEITEIAGQRWLVTGVTMPGRSDLDDGGLCAGHLALGIGVPTLH